MFYLCYLIKLACKKKRTKKSKNFIKSINLNINVPNALLFIFV